MDKLLIHIGYHKTGSSWLQRRLFSDADQSFSLPLDRREDVHRRIVMPNALDFSADRCREQLEPKLTAGTLNRVPVISSERLCGSPYSGGYDSKELANRLHAAFPEARVLIVIREQVSMLVSTYKAYVDKGGTCTLKEFFSPPLRAPGRIPWFDPMHFAYDRLIAHYQSLFGRPNVLVMTFEQLRIDPIAFSETICTFAGASWTRMESPERQVNPGIDASIVGLRRRLNPFLVRDPLNGYSSVRIPGFDELIRATQAAWSTLMPERLESRCQKKLSSLATFLIGDTYRESNSRSIALTGLALSEFGYALPVSEIQKVCKPVNVS